MRKRTLYLLVALFVFGCKKNSVSPSEPGSGGPPPPTSRDTSYISVSVYGSSVKITSIHYNRGSGFFNFTAQNDLQKIDVYCFHFYEPNRWNYQYSDSINYSSRKDVIMPWSTTSAKHWPDVYFNCCAGPLEDKIIDGTFSGTLQEGESESKIAGSFHLIF